MSGRRGKPGARGRRAGRSGVSPAARRTSGWGGPRFRGARARGLRGGFSGRPAVPGARGRRMRRSPDWGRSPHWGQTPRPRGRRVVGAGRFGETRVRTWSRARDPGPRAVRRGRSRSGCGGAAERFGGRGPAGRGAGARPVRGVVCGAAPPPQCPMLGPEGGLAPPGCVRTPRAGGGRRLCGRKGGQCAGGRPVPAAAGATGSRRSRG